MRTCGGFLRTIAPLCVALAAASVQAGIEGDFTGEFDGRPARASLVIQKAALTGSLDVGGRVYAVSTILKGEDVAEGRLRDPDGAVFSVAIRVRGDELIVHIFTHGAGRPPRELTLRRSADASARVRAFSGTA